ncbi:hypothetical protein SAMN05444682_10735 [Parapedobacter indicus]|uniref:Uncharacterized protein n=1 Tax=Parapedobacter indicus TaxID=1477437 RepID=A0A1I3MYT9_9SPHI|nr:hypothetical protein CLV26_10735 [Parapedobacter indicus]SFJ01935.1 hypothetical protein SAMN05444682_10735 [Parapedobacter indicus]
MRMGYDYQGSFITFADNIGELGEIDNAYINEFC